MHKKLADISLKTGESVGICLVQTPDEIYTEQILSFLGHKEGTWRWHLELSFEGKLDELETRFYFGTINDRIIGNVSTWEHDSLGVLGHVFTAEDQRRKGVFKALLASCIQDFQRRGGKTMILGTPADAPWNRIYKSVGFGSIVSTRKLQKDEVMRYDVDPDFERKYFQPGQVHTREPKWGDWPAISMLYSVQGGWFVRSKKHGISGAFDYEDGFLDDMKKMLQGKCQARVLLTQAESIVGHATLAPDNRWDCQAWLLDFFLHPLFESHVFRYWRPCLGRTKRCNAMWKQTLIRRFPLSQRKSSIRRQCYQGKSCRKEKKQTSLSWNVPHEEPERIPRYLAFVVTLTWKIGKPIL